jgi:hypothetical protein
MKNWDVTPFIQKINLVLEQEGMNPLPDLYKHMVLAIFRKGVKNEQNFLRAMEAAFSFLLTYGHITPQSNINNMQLTSTGASLNSRHVAEPKSKSDLFDQSLAVVKQVG